MNVNVLKDIKKRLGGCVEGDHFDPDILMDINTAVSVLRQLGEFQNQNVIDENSTWDEIIEGHSNAEFIKSYVYMKVRMIFDPPTGSHKDAMEKCIEELQWRINVQTDN